MGKVHDLSGLATGLVESILSDLSPTWPATVRWRFKLTNVHALLCAMCVTSAFFFMIWSWSWFVLIKLIWWQSSWCVLINLIWWQSSWCLVIKLICINQVDLVAIKLICVNQVGLVATKLICGNQVDLEPIKLMPAKVRRCEARRWEGQLLPRVNGVNWTPHSTHNWK